MYVAHDVSACVECEMCDCEYMYASVCVRSDVTYGLQQSQDYCPMWSWLVRKLHNLFTKVRARLVHGHGPLIMTLAPREPTSASAERQSPIFGDSPDGIDVEVTYSPWSS